MIKTAVTGKAEVGPNLELFPLWAKCAAGFIVLFALLGYILRKSGQNDAYFRDLNALRLEVSKEENGNKSDFGTVYINGDSKPYTEALSACALQTELALKVYRRLLTDKATTKSGKIVGAQMAFYLSQEKDKQGNTRLSLEDLRLLIEQLSPDNDIEVRRVVQACLAELILVRTTESEHARFKALPAATDKETRHEVELFETDMLGHKVSMVSWSDPGTCKTWLELYAKDLKWAPELRRFAF